MLPSLKSNFSLSPVSQQLVENARAAARPAFELQFHRTQNAVLDRMNREIGRLRQTSGVTGATALLETQIASLQDRQKTLSQYAARVKTNDGNLAVIATQLGHLTDFATAGDAAGFDAAKTEAINLLNKLQTPVFEPFGAPDRLRQRKAAAIQALEGLDTNGFASQADIDTAKAAIADVDVDLKNAASVVAVNRSVSFGLNQDLATRLTELRNRVASIRATDETARTKQIETTQKRYAAILSALSLSFEASQNITDLTANAILPEKTPPGSVLNLFS